MCPLNYSNTYGVIHCVFSFLVPYSVKDDESGPRLTEGSRTEQAAICTRHPAVMFITWSSIPGGVVEHRLPDSFLTAPCSSGGKISCRWGVAERETQALSERETQREREREGRRHSTDKKTNQTQSVEEICVCVCVCVGGGGAAFECCSNET